MKVWISFLDPIVSMIENFNVVMPRTIEIMAKTIINSIKVNADFFIGNPSKIL